MFRFAPALVLALPLLAGGCASEPFVDYVQIRERSTVALPMRGTATIAAVCYSGNEAAQAKTLQALADAHCAKDNKKARYHLTERYGCTWLAPHVAFFTCVEPAPPPPGEAPS
ncbi:hypothetical protein [Pararhodospirillum photometricum]|uniref:hypothetical protein n=1 Tax=Pararhodospirillum photometricum TaxID=1084 RepID=UPI0002E06518|nr:hypothetical protein [Pararhodospirillum photometricum]